MLVTIDPSLKDILRHSPVLADLTDEQLAWLADRMEVRVYEPGEVTTHEGEPAEHLFVVLEGEVQARQESSHGPDVPVYIASAGQVTGLLPHSRMTHYMRTGRAVTPTRIAWFHKRHFHEMFELIPELGPRLLALMADRIRDTTKSDIQHEKLAALGKLSAGLAHELNNPAAAARSSASALFSVLERLRQADYSVAKLSLPPEARSAIAELEENSVQHAKACTAIDALTRSDREERLGTALSKLGLEEAWTLAPDLVDAGLDEARIEGVTQMVGREGAAAYLSRLAALLELYKLASE
ncbi:MAG TPA: cyclic nucleotide-binding domain-containing protein, partial [Bryobacteraceae bacterium]|nr:cyclic nucleotide-binding domain-containing protein [Bryobacteraceae bacterium]